MDSWIQTGRQVVERVQRNDLAGQAAELAYRFLFALFPLFIVIAALGGMLSEAAGIDNPTDEAIDMVGDAMPEDAEDLVVGQLDRVLGEQNPGLFSIGLIVALWAASSGTKAIMKAMNRSFDVEESRPTIRRNLVALGLTLVLGAAVIGGFVLLMAGQFFANELGEALGMEEWGSLAIQVVQWPLAGLLLVLGIAFLYWAAPNTDLPFRWITPGALLFVIGWLIATAAFGFYVSNFGAYADTYGALGGIIILMIWFYLSAFILLVGAEVNAVLTGQAREASTTGLASAQPPSTAAVRSQRPAPAPRDARRAPPARRGAGRAAPGALRGGIARLRGRRGGQPSPRDEGAASVTGVALLAAIVGAIAVWALRSMPQPSSRRPVPGVAEEATEDAERVTPG